MTAVTEAGFLPDESDVAFYEAHGWWISPVCLTADDLDGLNYGCERYYAGERDYPLLVDLPTDWTPDKGDILRQNDYVSLQLEEFQTFVTTSPIAAMAARLARTDSIRLFHDQLLYKPPGVPEAEVAVGWHTDRAYWQTSSSLKMLTAWVPLQDVTVEMGTMVVLDKSHRWDDRPAFRNFHAGDMTGIIAALEAEGHAIEPVPVAIKAGQVSFHHCKTIHGSYANRADRPRIAFAVHFQDHDNAYREAFSADGKKVIHLNDLLCRKTPEGVPDYADPAICPRLWPI